MNRYDNPMFEENKVRQIMEDKKKEAANPSQKALSPVSRKTQKTLMIAGIFSLAFALIMDNQYGAGIDQSLPQGRLLSFIIGFLYSFSAIFFVGLFYRIRERLRDRRSS